ncbi:pimeloyl-ACP methyl ester carboxylesterase [Arthrobacter stackebrandtii]|uniref:Pimeloyl-ACP methyl ester carboxylesterase n=1 Tax=Arthrobacter stackebrandtii TaxID=272161 RepID=A0ABS4YVP3_9MICC|nr:alpha/beta hydrolase [Arthrobacter stackebrandtii]MBP2412565.1 pimeloyl-ACP methyl ester carboxylesterase [Arthrobacter stackebrandtii]
MTTAGMIDGESVEYLLRPGGRRLAVLFHGGHMRAELDIGQNVFLDAGCSILQPSRPGYGRTPLEAGPDPAAFSDRIALLCKTLGYDDVVAVGVSAGGRTAMTFAERHPHLVTGLILESSTSFLPWPGRFTRIVARVAFRPRIERVTWALTRYAFAALPGAMLRVMLSSLSTLPARTAYARLQVEDRAKLAGLLSRMRSGSGFSNDLREPVGTIPSPAQPTLIVASRNDAAVGPEHPQALAAQLRNSTLVMTDSVSHFLWIGPHADDEERAVARFLGDLS